MKFTSLKIKLKSLAAETRIIRAEERKLGKRALQARAANRHTLAGRADHTRASIAGHRIHVVRAESRLSYLAYAFLRGVPRVMVESSPRDEPSMAKIAAMVTRFGKTGRTVGAGAIREWWDAVTDPKTLSVGAGQDFVNISEALAHANSGGTLEVTVSVEPITLPPA